MARNSNVEQSTKARPNDQTKLISLQFPYELWLRGTTEAARQGVNIRRIILTALDEYLDRADIVRQAHPRRWAEHVRWNQEREEAELDKPRT
jgi:hypothetical protein